MFTNIEKFPHAPLDFWLQNHFFGWQKESSSCVPFCDAPDSKFHFLDIAGGSPSCDGNAGSGKRSGSSSEAGRWESSRLVAWLAVQFWHKGGNSFLLPYIFRQRLILLGQNVIVKTFRKSST